MSESKSNSVSGALGLTLVDYLAVVGFDKDKGLELDRNAEAAAELSGSVLSKAPLDRAYQTSVLQVFPPSDRVNYPFTPEIAQLCMPKGLRFYTEKKVPPQTEFHSFVLTKEDGSRIYGCAFTFFEPVHDIQVRQQMLELNHQYIQQKVESDVTARNDSHHGLQQTHTLPRNISSTSRRNFSHRESYYDSTNKNIFVSKCICVVQRLPMLFSTQHLLCSLYIAALTPRKSQYTLEQLIYWSLHQVPLPIPGTSLQCNYGGLELAVRRPAFGELHFFDYPMCDLFSLIDVETFVRLFTSFMLEHQILLCSRQMDRLMLVAECLSVLLFPFRWQLPYVPIVPYSQLNFIEAPVAYLLGFCYEDRIPDQIFQSNICILDIDSKKLDTPEEVQTFPQHEKLVRQLKRLYLRFQTNPTNFYGDSAVKEEAVEEKREMSPVKVVMRRDAGVQQRRNNLNRKGIVDELSEGVTFRQTPTTTSDWTSKRMSRSFDNSDSLEAFKDEPHYYDEMEESTSNNNIVRDTVAPPKPTENVQKYFNALNFNTTVRELFLHHFVQLFSNYEQFVVINKMNDKIRDSVVDFDKASFLSDQPDSYLPFLAAFLETQMFTSFIDAKLKAQFNEVDENLMLFDKRINDLKTQLQGNGSNRVSMINQMPEFNANAIAQEQPRYHYEVPSPSSHLASTSRENNSSSFPEIDPDLFDVSSASQEHQLPWMAPNNKAVLLAAELDEQKRNSNIASPRKKQRKKREPVTTDTKEQNYAFVKQLLKETKVKTNRLLLMKMGKEALDLGHHDSAVQGVEENTLVAGFCDLLDRVWANDLKKKTAVNDRTWTQEEKKRKSALWTNIFRYCENNKPDLDRVSKHNHPNVSPEVYDAINNNPEAGFEDRDQGALADIIHKIRNLTETEPEVSAWNKIVNVANFVSDKIVSKLDEEGNFGDNNNRERGRSVQRGNNTIDRLFGWRSNSVAPSEGDREVEREGRRPDKVGATRMGEVEGQRNLLQNRRGQFEDVRQASRTENQNVRPENMNQMPENQYSRPVPGNRPGLTDQIEHHRSANRPGLPVPEAPPSRNVRQNVAELPPHPQQHRANIYRHPEPQRQARPPLPRSIHKSSSVSDFAPQLNENRPPQAQRDHSVRRGRDQSRGPHKERKRSLSRSRDCDEKLAELPPLPTSLLFDFNNIFRMTEIRTDIGYARAFVRLALERKLLHSHLKTILSDHRLLRELYRRSGFLRSEDEREQFLYHILSLNAVDFTCFTNTFRSTRMQYEVLLVGTLDRFQSSGVWIMCAGTLGSTQKIAMPPNSLQFTFDHKNLGILTTLRIGHREKISKWLLQYVLVRNNITGQLYKFNCKKWFGRSVEDGALERVLVAEVVSQRATEDNSPTEQSQPQQYLNSVKNLMPSSMMNKLASAHGGSLSTLVSGAMSRPESPVSTPVKEPHRRRSSSRSEVGYPQQHRNQSLSRPAQYNYYSAREGNKHQRSPSVSEAPAKSWDPRTNELQHRIGEAVNALVKHFLCQSGNPTANLTQLLCGEKGLIKYLEQVFILGRKDSLFRFFGKTYPWDYIEKSFSWFANLIPSATGEALSRDQKSIIIYAYDVVTKIAANANVGKEGKFHAFLLLTLRDHQLGALLSLLAWTPVTKEFYDETSILNQPGQLKALNRLLNALHDFNFNFESSLTYGIGI
ncbi:unnamed protein product [Bursaphelenchus okinawaensis]|uniref:UDENN domain-containing protein n=1 Tax=Bursaphelenchus okinawaensis TaxID=465554 RepID=A0A811K938_9BILA|nr:unnamed protein product [Bursaphelenchus okinawaensis]CAG9095468.1 unnamed protein product [Bursaphelenchus okinawaensis]